MYVMLATLLHFEFSCLLRFIIISSVLDAFPLATKAHAEKLELKIFAKKVLRKFYYWNRGNAKRVSVQGKKVFL